MISKAIIVTCDRCSATQQFSANRPQKIRDPDKLYMDIAEIPTEEIPIREILNECSKLGWIGDEKSQICPLCQ